MTKKPNPIPVKQYSISSTDLEALKVVYNFVLKHHYHELSVYGVDMMIKAEAAIKKTEENRKETL